MRFLINKSLLYFYMVGGHSGLWCDTSSKWVCLYPMPHYGRGCRISTLIMVPINFWRNSDLFKKKNIFLAQKLTILELFKENLWNFSKKISQTQNINLWNVLGATMMIWVSNWIIFGPFGSEMNYLGRSVKYQCSRAQWKSWAENIGYSTSGNSWDIRAWDRGYEVSVNW